MCVFIFFCVVQCHTHFQNLTIVLEGFWPKFVGPPAMASSMPLCSECRRHVVSDLRSEDQLCRWRAREGICWRRSPNGTAYFDLCLDCHKRRWPNDRRSNTMFSKPAPAHLHIEAPAPRPLRLALETSRAQGSKTDGRRGTDL